MNQKHYDLAELNNRVLEWEEKQLALWKFVEDAARMAGAIAVFGAAG